MYDSPETPQPLLSLAADLARQAFQPKGEPLVMGPFVLPMTDKQRNACAAFWSLARVKGVPVVHIRDDAHQTVQLLAYPEGR